MSNLSFSKANQIVRILLTKGGPMHVEALADQLGMRRNSVEKLAGLLEHHQWVTRIDDIIAIGPMLREIGLATLSLDSLPARAEPILNKLHSISGIDAGLCIYTAPTIVFVKKIGFTNHPSAPMIGAPYTAHVMANGRCILATYPPAYIDEYIDAFLGTAPANWIDEKVRRPVTETRKRGFGMTTADRIGHVEAICAPVFAASGEAVGAINLWRPCEAIEDSVSAALLDQLPHLLAAAHDISEAMGAPTP